MSQIVCNFCEKDFEEYGNLNCSKFIEIIEFFPNLNSIELAESIEFLEDYF